MCGRIRASIGAGGLFLCLCWWAGAANALTRDVADQIVPDEANIIYGDCPVAVHTVVTDKNGKVTTDTCSQNNACVLDVYLPPDGTPVNRGLVFVHGGTWATGSKDNLYQAQALLDWFTQRGYMIVGVEFRQIVPPLSNLPPLPASPVTYADSASDVAHAIAWFEANRDTYHVKYKEPVVLGYSSGAHLVALVTADDHYLKDAGLKDRKIAAQILLDDNAYNVPLAIEDNRHNIEALVKRNTSPPLGCPPLKLPFKPPYAQCNFLVVFSGILTNIPVIEYVFGTTEPGQLAGSPSNYVATAKDIPPTFLLSAEPRVTLETPPITRVDDPLRTDDDIPADYVQPWPPLYLSPYWSRGEVAYQTTRAYYDQLIEAGVDATHVHLSKRDHKSLVERYLADQDDTPDPGPADAVEGFLSRLGL